MTISEKLQFSVLGAPVAALDRRTLSQAWYSALYGSAQVLPAPCNKVRRGRVPMPSAKQHDLCAQPAVRRPGQESKAAATSPAVRQTGTAPERRAARSPLARKIERTFLRPGKPVRHATFSVDGTNARVHVIVKRSGASTQLVALCPPRIYSRVANALLQARFALAARGIALETKLHEAAV